MEILTKGQFLREEEEKIEREMDMATESAIKCINARIKTNWDRRKARSSFGLSPIFPESFGPVQKKEFLRRLLELYCSDKGGWTVNTAGNIDQELWATFS
jgi:hypothetical protein